MSTPIDPGNEADLKRAFVAGVRANLDDPMAGVVALARAVCPEHHAVFDTRTHVAVPVSDLRVALDWHGSAPEPVDAKNRIRSLLPKEATDEA